MHTILGDHKLKTEGMARGTAKAEEGLRTACPAPAFKWATREAWRGESGNATVAASASARLFMANALG